MHQEIKINGRSEMLRNTSPEEVSSKLSEGCLEARVLNLNVWKHFWWSQMEQRLSLASVSWMEARDVDALRSTLSPHNKELFGT